MADSQLIPHLLRLPLELRLQIYSYLLTPDTDPVEQSGSIMTVRDYHEYEKSSHVVEVPHYVLKFRNAASNKQVHLRSSFKVRSGRLRSACEDATYFCVNVPEIHTSILGANCQIHNEAAPILYGSYIFDFDTHIEGCVPFLADLTPFSRNSIRRFSIVKRALPYEKDFDRCEWADMCSWLSTMSLQYLSLGIVAGKPALGWDGIQTFAKDDFKVVTRMEEMQWVRDLYAIKTLQSIDVRACIEHSPPPESNAMAFFVTFSASVEPEFAQFLHSQLIQSAA